MDQYLSTYRKDFMWPYVRTFPIRTSPGRPDRALRAAQPYRQLPCTCGAEPSGLMPPKEYVGPPDAEAHQWSRLGPMAPLIDPKLYPAKMGPAPEFEITRYDQPNTYLRKLEEKYPYLYKVLQSAPPDEMIRRVNEDRLRTTYQVDYSHMDEHPSADYEKLLAKAGMSDWTQNVPCSRKIPPLDCRAHIRPPEYSGRDFERLPRNGPEDFAHRAGRFDDYQESADRRGSFENASGGYGGFGEARNDRGDYRNNADGYGDFREATNDRRNFRMIEDRGNERDDFRMIEDRGNYRGNERDDFRMIEDRGNYRSDERGGFRMIEDRGNYRANERGDFRMIEDRNNYRGDERGGFRMIEDRGNYRGNERGDIRMIEDRGNYRGDERGGFRMNEDRGNYRGNERGDFRVIEDRGNYRGDERGGLRMIEDRGNYQRIDRGDFRMIEDRRNDQGGPRNNAGRFVDHREATNDRGTIRNDAGGSGDYRQATSGREGFREDSAKGTREYGDSRGVPNPKGNDYKVESGKSPREAAEAVKSSDGGGGGGGGGGGSAGKKADTGGFGSADGDEGKSKRTVKLIEDLEAAKKPLPAWRSEYQEVIGQTGYDIIRDKMHQHGARSRGRNFIERIIMRCRV